MKADTRLKDSIETPLELVITGSVWMGAWLFCLGQIASVGVLGMGLPTPLSWSGFLVGEVLTLWATFTRLFPRHRLFFNGHRLLICNLQGHVLWTIDRPRGFCAPFFIGLQVSALQSIGFFKAQMKPSDFSRLARWAKGLDH